jgi:uncharacterized protein YjhX (UPF0386 family)
MGAPEMHGTSLAKLRSGSGIETPRRGAATGEQSGRSPQPMTSRKLQCRNREGWKTAMTNPQRRLLRKLLNPKLITKSGWYVTFGRETAVANNLVRKGLAESRNDGWEYRITAAGRDAIDDSSNLSMNW